MNFIFSCLHPRRFTLCIALVSAGLLSFGYVLQYGLDLVPCPLCIAQRLFYFVIVVTGISFYFYWEKAREGQWPAFIIGMTAFLGGSIAARQVWLQHFVTEVDGTKCGVSFGPFITTVLHSLGGWGNCVLVEWTFLTLSIAEWSLIWFIILFLASVWLFFRRADDQSTIA